MTDASAVRPHHLRDIRIGLDGSLIVQGAIDHPVDPQGYFPCPDAEWLSISRGGNIRRCRLADDRSGFHPVDSFGPGIQIPGTFATMIGQAFKLGAAEPLRATLGHQAGELFHQSPDGERQQPLTAWTLDIEAVDGAIDILLSARLHGSRLPE